MDNITSEQILDRADCLDDQSPEDTYHKSYIHFVNYFSGRNVITEQDLIIGANFTYGWMPTMLNFKSNNFQPAVAALNKAKGAHRISNEDLIILKTLINNSLVGASKLLHFVNPNEYAIWDSRVCHFLTGKSYKVENTDLFWAYLDLCRRVACGPRFDRIHAAFINRIGYEVSPMRTLEQIMFISSNKPLQRR